jgi:hypothetical protein
MEDPMSSINDLKRQFYIDSGIAPGPLNDMEMKWLFAQGATTGSINDRWRDYLSSQGYTTGSFQDRLFQLLGDLGYSGSLVDRLKAYYLEGGAFNVLDQSINIGAETRAGAGGSGGAIPVYTGTPTGSFSISGGQSANYNVDSSTGAVTPSSNGSATNGDTFTWGDGTTTATITINAAADTYHVANGTEFEALDTLSAATLAGQTIIVREDNDNVVANWDNSRFRFREMATALTIKGETSSTQVSEMQFTECSGITVEDITFFSPWTTAGNESGYMLKFSGNNSGTWNQNITVRRVSFSSDPGNYDPDGVDAWKLKRGVQVTNVNSGGQQTIRIYECTFELVYVGSSVIGGNDIEIYANDYISTFADQCTSSIQESPWNITVRDNFFGNQFGVAGRDYTGNGGPSDPHAGKVEFNFTGWSANASGINVLRNVSNNTDAYYSGNSISIKDLSGFVITDVEVSGNILQQTNRDRGRTTASCTAMCVPCRYANKPPDPVIAVPTPTISFLERAGRSTGLGLGLSFGTGTGSISSLM